MKPNLEFSTRTDLPKERTQIACVTIATRELLGLSKLSIAKSDWSGMSKEEQDAYKAERSNMIKNMSSLRKKRKVAKTAIVEMETTVSNWLEENKEEDI